MRARRAMTGKMDRPLTPKKLLAHGALVMAAAVPAAVWIADGMSKKPATSAARRTGCPLMPAPGKQVTLDDGCSLTCELAGRPKLGINVLKIRVFDRAGQTDTSLDITGEPGMPAMSRGHASGARRFTISSKGDYLLPVTVVMPGGWEVLVTVSRRGKIVYRGRYPFDV